MNEDELAGLLGALEQGLNQIGLSVLVAQERISAAEGKAEKPSDPEMVELRYERSRQGQGKAFRVRADDVRVRQLTSAERLAELLDLIEAAVGGTYAIEMRIRNDVKGALGTDNDFWGGEVVFATPPESELSGTTVGDWALTDDSTLRQRESAVHEVILLVNRLREEAELPRSDLLHAVVTSDADTRDAALMPGEWS
jgi:hypothetical protein